jgi:hypothetical protein
MNATNIKEWTKEHEEAKQEFIEKYLFPDWKPSWERKQLREILWEKALKEGQLVFVPAGERKAYFRLKDVG